MHNPYILLVGAILLGLLGWRAYDWAYDRGRDAEKLVWQDAAQKQAEAFAKRLEEQQQILEATERRLEETEQRKERVRVVTREVYRNDPVAREWAAVPWPDSLRRALSRATGLPIDPDLADPPVPDTDARPPSERGGG